MGLQRLHSSDGSTRPDPKQSVQWLEVARPVQSIKQIHLGDKKSYDLIHFLTDNTVVVNARSLPNQPLQQLKGELLCF